MRAGGSKSCRRSVTSAGAVAVLALTGCGAVGGSAPVADTRACAQSGDNNLSLADATRHFQLALPAGATHLVFTADAGGLQRESGLTVRFTTTPADLVRFLAASHFTSPSTTTKLSSGWDTYSPGTTAQPSQGPCGLTPPVNATMLYSTDGPGFTQASTRSVAVDEKTDPAHPVVWVNGSDL